MIASGSLQFWRSSPRGLWVLFGLYLALALAYNFVFPPFEPSDEGAHFRYVRYLIEERRFPVARSDDRSEFHQPPLYYALAAAVSWPFPAPAEELDAYAGRVNPYRAFRYWEPGLDNKNLLLHGPWDLWPFHGLSLSAHIARLASLLTGGVTVLLTYQIARALVDEQTSLAVTGLVAFNPMFLAVSASLQNDAGAAACGAVFIWLGLKFYQSGFTVRRAGVLGLALGLGVLMKITVGLLIVPAVFVVGAWGRARRQPLPRIVGYLALMGAAAAVTGGWWYLRNQFLYGEPTALGVNFEAYGGRSIVAGVAVWWQALPYAWSTFWGRFGHTDVVLPDWIYLTLGVITLLALLGLVFRILKSGEADSTLMAFLILAGVSEFAGLMGYLTLSPSGYMGRYTFPALPAYMTLFVFGLLGLVPLRAHWFFLKALLVAMLFFPVWTFVAYLLPVYTPPPALPALPPEATPLEATLGDVAVLKGYKVSADHARPGDRVYVTLYWRPLDRTERPYSVFIHLFDRDGTLVAQRDTYPGLGRNPTTAWTPGRMFADDYLVVIPETAFAPTAAHWDVGLWQADTGDRAFVLDPSGQPAAAEVSFGDLAILPRPGSTPNPVDLNFGDALRLTGYSLPTRVLKPGQPFDLTVYWQPTAGTSRRYLFFVHVADAGGNLLANNAFEVRGGEQTVQVLLSPDAPPGVYSLIFGVFYDDAQAGQVRLKILAADGHEVSDEVRLTGVRVVAP